MNTNDLSIQDILNIPLTVISIKFDKCFRYIDMEGKLNADNIKVSMSISKENLAVTVDCISSAILDRKKSGDLPKLHYLTCLIDRTIKIISHNEYCGYGHERNLHSLEFFHNFENINLTLVIFSSLINVSITRGS